jgi:hypothetical protein
MAAAAAVKVQAQAQQQKPSYAALRLPPPAWARLALV